MSPTISFHRLAEQELNDAVSYYHLESPGLGEALLQEIRRSVQAIVDHPEAGLDLLGGVRRRLARRFPYAVLCSVKPGEIRILAVMHLKRRPQYWVGRE